MNPTVTPTKRDILQNKLDSGQSIFKGGVKPPEIYGATPIQPPANIDTTVPNVIPAKALSGNVSYNDLRSKRNNLEQQGLANQADTQRHNDLLGRANSPLTGSPITNPDAYINELLLNRPTQTQTQLDTLGGEQASQTRGFAGELTSTQEKASKQFGVGEAQTALGETQSRIADRTVKLRQALRDFETNAEQRGVAREFVQSAKGKLQADAAAELADLSIIENAQLGNLQQAQAEVDRVIENKKQSFLYENQAIQQEIDNLNKKDDRESKLKATQLQIALDTRKQNIETQLANEKETRGYMAEAAANGADTATLDAIRNAKSPQEALFVAGDFIGKLDRQAKLASIRSSNASAALNEAELIAFNKAQEDASKGILSTEQMKTANDLNKDFESQPIVKTYNEGLQKYIVLEDTLANGIDGVQDLQLVYDFMKSVDPTSVVREVEFANAAKTGNIFQGAYAGFNKAFGSGGFLPQEVKDDFIRAARMSFEAKNNQYFNVKSEYANRINNTIGTNNGADYLTAYESAAPLTEIDFGLADSLSEATPDELIDIMKRSEGLVGVNLYK